MTRDELKAQREELLADIERRENENPFVQRHAPPELVYKTTERPVRESRIEPSTDAVVGDDATLMMEVVAEFVTDKLLRERTAHQHEVMALRERVARLEGVIAGMLENKERVFELPALPMRSRQ